MRIYNYDNTIDLMPNIIWQYGSAENLQKLLTLKNAWYQKNQSQFWDNWYRDVFNLDTANDFGLSIWGRILDFKRQISLKDGSVYTLITEQYRLLLKGRLLLFRAHGTVSEINTWLKLVFGNQGRAYVLDNFDMTTTFIFEFQPTEEQQFLLDNVDFLPHPVAVGYEIRIVPNIFFGFSGSGMQPFNHGVFYDN